MPGSGAALLVLRHGDAGEVGNGGPISGGIAAMKSGNGGKEASARQVITVQERVRKRGKTGHVVVVSCRVEQASKCSTNKSRNQSRLGVRTNAATF